ncbi:hypothetical protein VIGAN_02242100 [Vigna angularis var. angularis]|uniref:Uncharacterized protein n=1 Tax=Vigna angularis var. angularis TaxID=157739 RepID=A0A0S3RG70_PHAAN|nr:hypothetical protein VIGAN_02242100 [Vigna angularis var. angularis]
MMLRNDCSVLRFHFVRRNLKHHLLLLLFLLLFIFPFTVAPQKQIPKLPPFRCGPRRVALFPFPSDGVRSPHTVRAFRHPLQVNALVR